MTRLAGRPLPITLSTPHLVTLSPCLPLCSHGVDMQPDASVQLQAIIDRILQGDRAARRELLDRACGRLRRLAARMLNDSFPALRARHEVDSIVHETWIRLIRTL